MFVHYEWVYRRVGASGGGRWAFDAVLDATAVSFDFMRWSRFWWGKVAQETANSLKHVCLRLSCVLCSHCCSQGPVWKQLEARCGKSAVCLQARLQRQDAQITAQQAEVAEGAVSCGNFGHECVHRLPLQVHW